jgi:hypothetical protein
MSAYLSIRNGEPELDWDYDIKDIGPGYLSLYFPEYGKEARIHMFHIQEMNFIVEDAKRMIKTMEKRNDAKDCLVGLNSNSLTDNENRHNLFMEWDKKYGLPDIERLKRLKGVVSETNNGYHFIKEERLRLEDMLKIMKDWRCCEGFINCTAQRGWATLRVSPKPENNVRIINYRDGLLYNIYKEFVLKLGGEVCC